MRLHYEVLQLVFLDDEGYDKCFDALASLGELSMSTDTMPSSSDEEMLEACQEYDRLMLLRTTESDLKPKSLAF